MIPLHLFVASLLGWFQRDLHEIILYLREENRVLKAQLRSQRVRLTDDERRCLAVLGAPLGRRAGLAMHFSHFQIASKLPKMPESAQ